MARETIFALATAPGRAAVAVIRLSGPGAGLALKGLAGRLPPSRRASLARLTDANGQTLDQALILWFPAPDSYTGEDCAELHLHGGAAVVEAVQAALLALGLRPADPGEFTRRAFEAGKLDLAQAEGVADLIDAQTAAQASQALAQLGGALSRRHEAWRAGLIEILALLEAGVDFPDEDVPGEIADGARGSLQELLTELNEALADTARGQRIRDGYRIAVIGAPNAGKSSLFNALIAREAAIVTATPGTTRDVIEAPLVLAGYKVILADTAGVRESTDVIELEGVRRARAWAQDADLRLWAIDGAGQDDGWRLVADLAEPDDFCLINKADLGLGSTGVAAVKFAAAHGLRVLPVSASDGQGLAELATSLSETVVGALSANEFPTATRFRHVEALNAACEGLMRALANPDVELMAEDVRLAARALGRITGRIDSEEVLGAIFGKFCIGK